MDYKVGQKIIRLIEGDITALKVGAIVNPANDQLILGGGVAGAIRTKGGPAIQSECDRIGGTPVGTAISTTAGDLPANRVIHAVGPRWGEGDEEAKLRSAVISALEVADKEGLKSIALPAISTGIFGFPLDLAAGIIIRAIVVHLSGETSLQEVVLCLFDRQSYDAFESVMRKMVR